MSTWDKITTRLTHTPPPRVLLCLGPCHGEFYLPLEPNEHIACPNDSSHPIAIYSLAESYAASPDVFGWEEDE